MQNQNSSNLQSIARYLIYKYHLSFLFNKLKQNHIEFIVFKGWSFIPDLYPDPATRPFTDVDILIHLQDYSKTIQIMNASGFFVKSDFTVRAGSKPAHSSLQAAPPLIPLEITCSHPPGIHIDLHTHIMQLAWWHPAFPIDIEEVWRQTQPYQDSTGLQLTRFSPELTFLHLCLHLFNHGIFSTHFHIYQDLIRLLDKYNTTMNWDYIQHTAKQWGLQNIVYWVVKTLSEEFRITPPAAFQPKAHKNSLQYLYVKAHYSAIHQKSSTKAWRTSFLLRLALIDNPALLPQLLWHALFPPAPLRALIHNRPTSLLLHWRRYTHRLLRQ